MTVTQKHSAPLHPRLPTCDENSFCRTSFLSWELWGFKTSGCINVSLIRFQTTSSSDERKRLFPCIPGCMWLALIFSLTVSVRVKSGSHLLVESVILPSESFQVSVHFLSVFANVFIYHFEITGHNGLNSPKSNFGTVLHDIHVNCNMVLDDQKSYLTTKKERSMGSSSNQSEGKIWEKHIFKTRLMEFVYTPSSTVNRTGACAMFGRQITESVVCGSCLALFWYFQPLTASSTPFCNIFWRGINDCDKFTNISNSVDTRNVCWLFGWAYFNDQSENKLKKSPKTLSLRIDLLKIKMCTWHDKPWRLVLKCWCFTCKNQKSCMWRRSWDIWSDERVNLECDLILLQLWSKIATSSRWPPSVKSLQIASSFLSL